MRKRTIGLIVLGLVTFVAVYFGWRAFWFLTDDAFIAFRYVSNSRLGYGYVWNAPPFRPVEGYTSFLWVVLLDVVWRITGADPPRAANYLSLIFTYLNLLVAAFMVLRMRLRPALAPYRILLLAFVFVWAISNRTFLAWSSSGLETGLFNFLLTSWVYCCVYLSPGSRNWVFSISSVSALLTLTRPDGLLFALITILLIAVAIYEKVRSARGQEPQTRVSSITGETPVPLLLAATPLLVIPIHLFWRRWFYQAWLPNTYYAKTVSGRFWIESGGRYLLSFVLEYALWIWLIALAFVIVLEGKRFLANRKLDLSRLAKAGGCTAVIAHVLYYTVVIGGDHFEYRVYSQLILLIAVSFLWLLNRLPLRIGPALLIFSVFIVFSWPIPWIHWAATHNIEGRRRSVVLRASVASAIQKRFPGTPSLLLAYPKAFDRLQDWLIGHYVCMRHQEHRNFYLYLKETLPSREAGMQLPSANYPVHVASSVGVVSWVLPRVNIIDILGLNDYVAARNPDVTSFIIMAHERRPPDGYIECFEPNVDFNENHFVVHERPIPMTADRIVRCEQQFAAVVDHPGGTIAPQVTIKNPIDERHFFVSQQYRDVLNREADPNGLDYWAEHLKPCPTGRPCFNERRALIDMVLFSADEFQETALFSFRLYEAAFGVAPTMDELTLDRKQLAVLDVKDWRDPDEVIPAQRRFVDDWMRREKFRAAYPDGLSVEDFVKRIFDAERLKLYSNERLRLIEASRAGKSKAEVLREVVEIEAFKQEQNKRAMLLLQWPLQLHRDIDLKDPRYRPWIERLDRHEAFDVWRAVCMFLTSEEYQQRFGSETTHHNSECQQ